ncbi:helix-turn-helix domain-containing protein [Spirillospora sp. NPDC052269]
MHDHLKADMFDELCPNPLTPIRVGDKWAGMIIRCLEDGPRRFSELRVPLRDITPKSLTHSLRTLEQGGLISRHEQNRSVEYALTPLGRSMLEPMNAACAWAEEHWDELVDANEATFQASRHPA